MVLSLGDIENPVTLTDHRRRNNMFVDRVLEANIQKLLVEFEKRAAKKKEEDRQALDVKEDIFI